MTTRDNWQDTCHWATRSDAHGTCGYYQICKECPNHIGFREKAMMKDTPQGQTNHCPMLIEADRTRCGEIIRELYNNPACSISLAVDAGSQLQNLLSVADAQDRKILELEQRVKVLSDALTVANNESKLYPEHEGRYSDILNQTPQQTAAQIERWHIEWMMKLPVVAHTWKLSLNGENIFSEKPISKLGDAPSYRNPIALVAISPLPNEKL